ncbi:hypothetical protein JRO89_XS05G0243600 [Xanthoceras sorbifolium]|uniref:DUF4220 domain-containing protein n=1 Tax=Xanthoceras sorbifolium TaxID=99658 RepID=A0ABQ8I3E1_9ROSI|nr:hypothetical protein JRO89_XS05G0243600 [Xanthoceras sorbifolium]
MPRPETGIPCRPFGHHFSSCTLVGGPDNINSYSLEDNELWLRHFLGLIVQIGVAFYVFLRFWSNNALTFLAIPVFITGIFKYGKRTWVLWSASTQRFKDSLGSSSDLDPCTDFFGYELGYGTYKIIMKQGINPNQIILSLCKPNYR